MIYGTSSTTWRTSMSFSAGSSANWPRLEN
jgi:hypothetical protein